LAVSAWGFVAAYVSLPIFRWLSLSGYFTKGDWLNPLIMSAPDIIAIVGISAGLAFIAGRLTRAPWWVAVSAFVVVLSLTAVDWSFEAEHRLFVFSHWLFWAFLIPGVVMLYILSRARNHHAV
jgi:hypothetical protein